MKEIFKYIDYRRYLADYYTEKKETTRYFSYRFFADRAGIKSPVFLKQVIDGQRNLTRTMIEKFIVALNLKKKESSYFKNLVLFNQSKDAHEKQEHYSILLSMMDYVEEYQLSGDQYEYFEKWYHCVIRELICLYDFNDDFHLLAKMIQPHITPVEAKKSVALLLHLNLIQKQQNGRYVQTNAAIVSNDERIAAARRTFNSIMLLLANDTIHTLPPDIRNVSGITMGISKSCYDVIIAEITAFKERIKSIVAQDSESTQVYHLGVQLFPVSDTVSKMSETDEAAQCDN